MKPPSTENNRDPAHLLNRDEPTIPELSFLFQSFAPLGIQLLFQECFPDKIHETYGHPVFLLAKSCNPSSSPLFLPGLPTATHPVAQKWGFEEA